MESIKCHCCNATLIYNLNDKELKCNFCGTICKIEHEKVTDAEFLKKRFMDAHKTSCPECGAKLVVDVNTISSKCSYCGASIVYNDKIDKVFKPKKILLFEIGLDKAREKVKKYFSKSAFQYKDYIMNTLQPIYLPYWMYDCTCEAEYEYYTRHYGDGELYNKKHFLETAKVECHGILADASIKIEDKLADQLDRYFDLSKLRDFDTSYIVGFCAEEYDVTFKSVFGRLNEKLKNEVVEQELGFYSKSDSKKINISKVQSTYIQLPFYYAEVNGLKVLVNGQTGDISINSKEYLKTEKRVAFEKFLYGETIQNNAKLIAFLGVILIAFIMITFFIIGEKVLNAFPKFERSLSILMWLGLIGGLVYCKFNRKKMPRRYIKNIIYNNKKELHVWDEITRTKNTKVNEENPYKVIILCLCLVIGIFILGIVSSIIKLIPTLLTENMTVNIVIVMLFGGAILYTIVRVIVFIIRCILDIKGKR